MNKLAESLERWSLDAVLVALVWALALGKAAGYPAPAGDMAILAMATWLTYVADRLWQVRGAGDVPLTDRHLYYNKNYKLFRNLWMAGFVVAVVSAILLLPSWKMAGGWVLVGVVVLYLWTISLNLEPSRRLLFKRILVPLVFTAGVGWMAESWRTFEGVAGLILLFSLALANVLLISYWENHDKEMPAWLPSIVGVSLLLVLGCGNFALYFYWPAGVSGLLCGAGYFFLLLQVKSGRARCLRAWVDGLLVLAGALVWALPG